MGENMPYATLYKQENEFIDIAIRILSDARNKGIYTDEQIKNIASTLVTLMVREKTENAINDNLKSKIDQLITGQSEEYEAVY